MACRLCVSYGWVKPYAPGPGVHNITTVCSTCAYCGMPTHPRHTQAARQRQALCQARNHALHLRFAHLYHTRRLRLDDAYRTLAAEFFISERTVMRILKRSKHDPITPGPEPGCT